MQLLGGNQTAGKMIKGVYVPALSVVGSPVATSQTVNPGVSPWPPASSLPQGLHARAPMWLCPSEGSQRKEVKTVLQLPGGEVQHLTRALHF